MSKQPFHEFMSAWREKHGLTQWQLARFLGVKHQERISAWESGNHNPRHPETIKWALYGLECAMRLGLKKPAKRVEDEA